MPRTYKPVPPSEHKGTPKRGPKPETLDLGRRCLELLGQGVDRSLLFARLHVTRKKIDHALRQVRQYEAQAAAGKSGQPGHRRKPRRKHRVVHQRQPAPPAGWDWQERAACKGKPLHWFFDPDGRESETEKQIRTDRAKAICAACPVRAACLNYSIGGVVPSGHWNASGTWGGLTEEERTHERRKRMRAASEARARDLAEAS